jgi:hypothetical protein
MSPIDRILSMYKYYLGVQDNKDYYYTLQGENLQNGETTAPLPTPWVKGQKVTSLIDFMLGKFIELIDNIDPVVKSVSKAATNRKTKLLEKMLLKFEVPELFESMSAYGVDFNPMGGAEAQFETPEAVYEFMENDYKERAEEMAVRLADDALIRNNFEAKYKKAALFLLLGGRIGLETCIHNRKPYFNVILPHELIVDTASGDDDLHPRDRFVGKIEYISREELLKYPLSNQEKKEISEMTANNMCKSHCVLERKERSQVRKDKR